MQQQNDSFSLKRPAKIKPLDKDSLRKLVKEVKKSFEEQEEYLEQERSSRGYQASRDFISFD